MTKTLTEQWESGDLDDGYYYLKMKDGNIFIDHTEYIFWAHEIRWETKDNDYVKEVLEPVPSYEEYKRLQEQLDDANKALKQLVCFGVVTEETKAEYEDPDDWECTDVAQEYLDKWGVK